MSAICGHQQAKVQMIYIMSAMRDLQIMSQGDTKYITDRDLYELNACRLYLRVTMLSNITNDTNTWH